MCCLSVIQNQHQQLIVGHPVVCLWLIFCVRSQEITYIYPDVGTEVFVCAALVMNQDAMDMCLIIDYV